MTNQVFAGIDIGKDKVFVNIYMQIELRLVKLKVVSLRWR